MAHTKTVFIFALNPANGNSSADFNNPTATTAEWINSPAIPEGFHKHFVIVKCYKLNVNSKTKLGSALMPTAGTVSIEATDTGLTYGSIPNGELRLTADTAYDRPNFMGAIDHIRVKVAGLAPSISEGTNTIVRVEVHSYN